MHPGCVTQWMNCQAQLKKVSYKQSLVPTSLLKCLCFILVFCYYFYFINNVILFNFGLYRNSNWMKAFKMKGEQGLTHEVSIDDTNNTVLPSIIAAYNNENDHKQQKSPRGQKRKHLSSNNSDKSLNKLLPSSTDNEFEYSNKYSKLSDDVEKIFNGNIDGLKLSQDLFSYYVMNNSKTSGISFIISIIFI